MKGADGKRPKKCRRCGRRVVTAKLQDSDEMITLAIVPDVYSPACFLEWQHHDACENGPGEAQIAELHEVQAEPLAFVRHECGSGARTT